MKLPSLSRQLSTTHRAKLDRIPLAENPQISWTEDKFESTIGMGRDCVPTHLVDKMY